jgi:hypothetical protein
MIPHLKILALAAVFAAGVVSTGGAVPIEIGTIVSGEPAGAADEQGYVNTLLGLPVPTNNLLIAGHVYTKIAASPGSPSVPLGTQDVSGNTSVPAGSEYVLAKYDGPNGGDVLWYLGGAAFVLPPDGGPWGWTNPSGQGLGLSHFTVYGSGGGDQVPDSGATIALLGLAMGALAILRRKIRA